MRAQKPWEAKWRVTVFRNRPSSTVKMPGLWAGEGTNLRCRYFFLFFFYFLLAPSAPMLLAMIRSLIFS